MSDVQNQNNKQQINNQHIGTGIVIRYYHQCTVDAHEPVRMIQLMHNSHYDNYILSKRSQYVYIIKYAST